MDRATDMGMLPKEADYPFAELIICMGKSFKLLYSLSLQWFNIAGFLLILLIESVVHKFFGGHGHGHGSSSIDAKNDDFLDSPQEITMKIPQVSLECDQLLVYLQYYIRY